MNFCFEFIKELLRGCQWSVMYSVCRLVSQMLKKYITSHNLVTTSQVKCPSDQF